MSVNQLEALLTADARDPDLAALAHSDTVDAHDPRAAS